MAKPFGESHEEREASVPSESNTGASRREGSLPRISNLIWIRNLKGQGSIPPGLPGGKEPSKTSFTAEISSLLRQMGDGWQQIRIREQQMRIRETHIIGEGRSDHPHDGQANRYLRDSLRIATETLDTAYRALQKLESHHASPDTAQVRKTISALSDTTLWYELLGRHGLANDSAARDAVQDLAERISRMPSDKVPADPLKPLLKDISLLREVIASALQEETPPLSPSFVRDCLSATSRIGAEVSVGLIAMLASAEAAGTMPARIVVVCTAIGIGTEATTRQAWGRFARAVRVRTVEAQLQQYHHELLDSLSDLVIYLVGDPPTREQRGLVLNIHLAIRLQIGHIEQLAATVVWPQRDEYRQELARVKKQLAMIPAAVAEGGHMSVEPTVQQFRDAHGRLEFFTRGIDEIKPSWRPSL